MLVPGLLLALATSPAPAVDLTWDAPAGCPPRAELERQISALLAGHPPADDRPRVDLRVERRGPQWLLHGEIHGARASGRRELGAATCAELVEAAALIVAIAVDPSFVPGEPAVPPPPAPLDPPPTPDPPDPLDPPPPLPPAPTAPEPLAIAPATAPTTLPRTGPATEPTEPATEPTAPATAPATDPRPPRSRRPALQLGVSAGLGLGALPAPAGLLRLLLGLEGRLWSAALVNDLWLPREGHVADAPAYGGRFWLWSAGLRGCAVAPLARRLTLPVCAGVAAGVHTGVGVGAVTHATRRTSPWLGATVGPGLQLRVSPRVRLGLALELLAILARPDFRIAGRGSACCSDRLGAQLTFAVLVVLPGNSR